MIREQYVVNWSSVLSLNSILIPISVDCIFGNGKKKSNLSAQIAFYVEVYSILL